MNDVLGRRETSARRAGAGLRPIALSLLAATLALTADATAAPPSPGTEAQALIGLINGLRSAPRSCQGRRTGPAAALAPQDVLSRLRIGPGAFLHEMLESAGYPVSRVQVIDIQGAPDAQSALALIQERYCKTLLGSDFSAIGVRLDDDRWQLVLARPFVRTPLPAWPEAGHTVLAAVNAARATARLCGDRHYPAVGPVQWNDALAQAALAHSQDMALHHVLSHAGSDGSDVAERATRVGYHWQRVGENIASGLRSPEEAVAAWLDSPGHCANIMSPGFTEMGAAWFMHPESKSGLAWWTQDFGNPASK
jgi:uncharacterized protein YkwD